MSARLHVSNTDQFNDVGEGGRQNGELWYRADLNEIRAFLSGQIRTLFNSTGQPGTPPPTVVQSGTLTRSTSDNTAVQNVTGLNFRPSMVYLIASDDAVAGNFSNGWTTGIVHSCTTALAADLTKCVSVKGIADGWTAVVGMSDDGFTAVWTKVGQGLNVTVSYLAIK